MKNVNCIAPSRRVLSFLLSAVLVFGLLLQLPAESFAANDAPMPCETYDDVTGVVDEFYSFIEANHTWYFTGKDSSGKPLGRSDSGASTRAAAVARDYGKVMTNVKCKTNEKGCMSCYMGGAKNSYLPDGDAQCSGFAAFMAYACFGAEGVKNGYKKISGGDNIRSYISAGKVHPGDIFRFSGHSFFVKSVEPDGTLNTIEGNLNISNRKDYEKNAKDRVNTYKRYLTTNEKSQVFGGGTGGKVNIKDITYIMSSPAVAEVQPSDAYMNRCSSYSTAVYLRCTSDTALKSLPCSLSTDSASESLANIPAGTELSSVKMYKNSVGHYWYQVNYGGMTGYTWPGDYEVSPVWGELNISGVRAPSSTHKKGAKLTLKGNISSSALPIDLVSAYVYPGGNQSGSSATGAKEEVNTKAYSIEKSVLDKNTKMGSLAKGSYTYVISAELVNTYSPNGETLKTEKNMQILYSTAFKVS